MSKRLKIAMFFSSDASQAGGVQEHVLNLSKNLSMLGHQVDIYGSENNILPYVNYHPISKSVTVPIPNGNLSNFIVKKTKTDLSEMLRQKKYDLVHIHEPYIPFINWEIMSERTIPKIATFHTGWDDDSIISFLNPFVSLFKNTFSTNFKGGIFVSKIAKKRWQDLFTKNLNKEIIYNGVAENFFPLSNKKKEKIIELLFLGRIVSRKGIFYLLKVINKISKKRQDFHLTIVGNGILRKKLELYVKLHNLHKFVTFTGEIIGKKRIKYYQAADIFCAPYLDEAFGITVLEAAACGVPTVGFGNMAFKEILKNYPYPKLLVETKNTKKLEIALLTLMSNEKMRKEISAWCVTESKKYNWKKITLQTEEFYYKILDKNEKHS